MHAYITLGFNYKQTNTHTNTQTLLNAPIKSLFSGSVFPFRSSAGERVIIVSAMHKGVYDRLAETHSRMDSSLIFT